MTSVTIEFFDLVNCADWFNWQQLPTKSQKGRERERVGHRRVAWLSGRTEANPESPFTASFPFFIFVRPEGLSESAVNYLPSYYDFDNHKANKTKGLGLEKKGAGFLFRGELSSRNDLQFFLKNSKHLLFNKTGVECASQKCRCDEETWVAFKRWRSGWDALICGVEGGSEGKIRKLPTFMDSGEKRRIERGSWETALTMVECSGSAL